MAPIVEVAFQGRHPLTAIDCLRLRFAVSGEGEGLPIAFKPPLAR
jgi:hypothetical protein